MKKLLLGALLIIGATAFGAVSVDLDTTGNATGSLGVTSRGEVVAPAVNGTLVITPTVNAGADGTSLSFDHGQIPKGKASELTGKFEAMVIKDDGSRVNISGVGEGNKKITVELYQGATKVNQGQYSTGTSLVVGNESTAGDSKLYYQLTQDSDVQGGVIYRGTVLSKVVAGNKAGTFLDRNASLKVTVTEAK